MGIDTILADIIFDWTFISNLIERDDGKTVREIDEVNNKDFESEKEQILAQTAIGPEVYY